MGLNFADVARLSRHTLDVYSISAQRHVSPEQLDAQQGEVRTFLDDVTRNLVIEINAKIAGMKHDPVIITVPKTWWDAVKDRWVPHAWRTWWRIDYNRVTIDLTTLFPDVAILPGQRKIQCVEMHHDVTHAPAVTHTPAEAYPSASEASTPAHAHDARNAEIVRDLESKLQEIPHARQQERRLKTTTRAKARSKTEPSPRRRR